MFKYEQTSISILDLGVGRSCIIIFILRELPNIKFRALGLMIVIKLEVAKKMLRSLIEKYLKIKAIGFLR